MPSVRGIAADLVKIGQKVRNLRGHGLEEGVSTRLLIYAAQMIAKGISLVEAAETAICPPSLTTGICKEVSGDRHYYYLITRRTED